jgi:hypothetical protein
MHWSKIYRRDIDTYNYKCFQMVANIFYEPFDSKQWRKINSFEVYADCIRHSAVAENRKSIANWLTGRARRLTIRFDRGQRALIVPFEDDLLAVPA